MSPSDRLQIRTIITGIALIVLTVISIYFIYGSYLFPKWPWMRFSAVMATLTCLWTYTLWFARITGGNEDTINPFLFGFVVIPLDFLLMYPGTEGLGIHSDSRGFTLMFVLQIVHGFGFYFIQQEIKKYLHDLASG